MILFSGIAIVIYASKYLRNEESHMKKKLMWTATLNSGCTFLESFESHQSLHFMNFSSSRNKLSSFRIKYKPHEAGLFLYLEDSAHSA